MSHDWANALLFRVTGSAPAAHGRDSNNRSGARSEEPVSATIDTGTGGQPQKRTQYFPNRDTGAIVKMIAFADGNLGQRLRAFVRFGHTGEYYSLPGQAIAAFVSLAACILVYTGLALAIRRLAAKVRAKRRPIDALTDVYAEDRVA